MKACYRFLQLCKDFVINARDHRKRNHADYRTRLARFPPPYDLRFPIMNTLNYRHRAGGNTLAAAALIAHAAPAASPNGGL
jgi:hypothetical protein